MVPEIELAAFAAAHADGAVVIDVREPLEYVAGHVPGGAAGAARAGPPHAAATSRTACRCT